MKVGEDWYVVIPGDVHVLSVRITELTEQTVVLRDLPMRLNLASVRYQTVLIAFLERIENES